MKVDYHFVCEDQMLREKRGFFFVHNLGGEQCTCFEQVGDTSLVAH